jgi:hypothetical protein
MCNQNTDACNYKPQSPHKLQLGDIYYNRLFAELKSTN